MKFFNVHDVLVIGIFAFVFVMLMNKALRRVGLGDFAASPNRAPAAVETEE